MTSLATKLYATQNNGGSPSVTINDIGSVLGSTASPATTSTLGVVKQATDVVALSSVGPGTPASGLVDVTATPTQATVNANFATLGTQLNAALAALKTAGLMA
jgi:hypothetical protein